MTIQIGLQTLLPAFLLFTIWRGKAGSRLEWALNLFLIGSILLFVALTSRWDMTSYYLLPVWMLLFIAGGVVGFRRIKTEGADQAQPKLPNLLFTGGIGAVVFALSIFVLSGYITPDGAIPLSYPLRDGMYYVGGGGNSRLINNHQAVASQKFALDIIGLNTMGSGAWGFAPAELDRYEIFGHTVYSPCSGTVSVTVDGLPDLNPPERDTENLAGNHVVLACHGVKVLLAHLQQGSVTVAEGDTVTEGQVLGRVGNSGNTSQPHLHIHAERDGGPKEILNGEGVPITLNNRFLVRNSLF